jgi:hypothetical protein
MWWFKLYPFIAPPCAALAGLVTWWTTRGRPMHDGTLLRHFLAALVLLLVAAAGVTRTETFRAKYDPSYEARRQFPRMPVHQAMKQYKPGDWAPVEKAVYRAFDDMVPPGQVLADVRAQYLPLARGLMTTTRASATLAYAEALLPVLQELQASDPQKCVRMAWRNAGGAPFDISGLVRPEVMRGYEEAVAAMIRQDSVRSAMPSEWKPEEMAGTAEMTSAYVEVSRSLLGRHEPTLAASLPTPAITRFDPAAACAATRELLSRVLVQRPPVARSLVRELLRG